MEERNPPLLIIAGTYREAEYYARRYKLSRKEWHWVKGIGDLHEHPDSRVIFAGYFSDRDDINQLAEFIRDSGMSMEHEPELPFEMPTD